MIRSFFEHFGQMALFGDLAIWLGLLREDDLDEALQSHAAASRRIGEHLVELGHMQERHTEVILRAQAALRRQQELPVPATHDNLPFPRVCEEEGLRITLSLPRDRVCLMTFEGVITDESAGGGFARILPAGHVRVADLAGITEINRGGTVALWFLLGGEHVILCNVPDRVRERLDELGALTVLSCADSPENALEEAAVLAADLPEAYDSAWTAALPRPHDRSRTLSSRTEPKAALDIHSEMRGGAPLVSAAGPLTVETRSTLLAAIATAAREGPVMLSLLNIDGCETDALGMVVTAVAESGGTIVAGPDIAGKLQRVGLDRLVPVRDAVREALQATVCPQHRFVGLKKRTVYHRPDCPGYLQSKPENRVELTEADVFKRAPCRICRPDESE